jgi:hypothetical protein
VFSQSAHGVSLLLRRARHCPRIAFTGRTPAAGSTIISGSTCSQLFDAAREAQCSFITKVFSSRSDLRGILSSIGDTERQCNVTALPPNLESAYHEFMAG